jgi:(p)ppGpp synthase/HD superfamily hydrolase
MDDTVEAVLRRVKKRKNVKDLVDRYHLGTFYSPVLEKGDGVLRELLTRMRDIDAVVTATGRTKEVESAVFKMLYMGTGDLNSIHDVIGVKVVTNNVDACYDTLRALLKQGVQPYNRIRDTLEGDPARYRSLDIHMYADETPFALQIRSKHLDELSRSDARGHAVYKQRQYEQFQELLKNRSHGMAFRLRLLRDIVHNFGAGFLEYRAATKDTAAEPSMQTLLDWYSSSPYPYDGFHELKLTDRVREVVGIPRPITTMSPPKGKTRFAQTG